MGVVGHVLGTGIEQVLLPGVVGRVAAVVRRNAAGAVIYTDAPQPNGITSTDQPANIFHDAQIEFAAEKFRLDFRQFRPVQPFALAFGGDDAVFNRPVVHLGHDLLGVVHLVVEAHLLLVRATADAGYNAHD